MLTIVTHGPLFQDDEFEEALVRAENAGIPDVDSLRAYPFSFIQRAEAASWYVALAQSSDMILYSDDICTFNDLDEIEDEATRQQVMLVCRYRFFW